MYTKFDFPETFRKKLYQKAGVLVKTTTTELEKKILEQHKLLTELTDIVWYPDKTTASKGYTLGIYIGAAEGLDNVHEAYFVGREIKENFRQIKVKFITSGAIGITKEMSEKMGVPGVNAKVMSQMLYEYGIPTKDVITEGKSLHTGMQASELAMILKEQKIPEVIAVADFWHQARLIMTMLGKNQNIKWFTHCVESDKDNIDNALFDWGQKFFQTPLLIAEVSRIHKYTEDKVGPCSLDELCSYLIKFHPKKLLGFIKDKKLSRLKFLWDKTHEDILNNFDKFKKYR